MYVKTLHDLPADQLISPYTSQPPQTQSVSKNRIFGYLPQDRNNKIDDFPLFAELHCSSDLPLTFRKPCALFS